MATTLDLIEESLERLAERAGDPTAAVYARLFAPFPEMEPLFIRDVTGDVRGEMLTRAMECALDLAGPNLYAANFIGCEVINHDGVGVPQGVFARFYEVMVESFAELMGEGWRDDYAAAWAAVTARVDQLTAAV